MHSKKQLCLLLHWLAVVVLAPLLASNLWSQVAAGTILPLPGWWGERWARARVSIVICPKLPSALSSNSPITGSEFMPATTN